MAVLIYRASKALARNVKAYRIDIYENGLCVEVADHFGNVGEGLTDRPMSAPDTPSSGDIEAAWDAWFREHMSPETP